MRWNQPRWRILFAQRNTTAWLQLFCTISFVKICIGIAKLLKHQLMFTPFLIIAVSSILDIQDIYRLSLIAIGSLGLILYHGATGAHIGYGIYIGKLTKHLITAIILQILDDCIILSIHRYLPSLKGYAQTFAFLSCYLEK